MEVLESKKTHHHQELGSVSVIHFFKGDEGLFFSFATVSHFPSFPYLFIFSLLVCSSRCNKLCKRN
jgi:hypothetical protein